MNDKNMRNPLTNWVGFCLKTEVVALAEGEFAVPNEVFKFATRARSRRRIPKC